MNDQKNEMGSLTRELLTQEKLEDWLTRALIPVEPNPRFLKRLRARLIRYHGGKPFSIWMILAVVTSAILLILFTLASLLRVVLALGGLSTLWLQKRKATNTEVAKL